MDNLTIIVPFWNGNAGLPALLDSVPKTIPVIVVDDHGDDRPMVGKRRNVRVIRPPRRGYFTGAVNFGFDACDTDVLILNQDTRLIGTAALDLLAEQRSRYAAIGERIAGKHPAWPNGYIHGTFMFIRRDALERVGLMNAGDYPLWGSTCEWQLRACRAGFEVLPLTEVPGFDHSRPTGESFGSAITETLRREPGKRRQLIKTPPEVSVVVPCYNYGRYIPDLLASLIGGPSCLGEQPGQSFQSFEVIIVDDGSDDDETLDILASVSDAWKGVRVYRQPNRGTAVACNTAIKRASGRLIARMDADDMMAPDRLEYMVRMARLNPNAVICDGMTLFHTDRGILRDGKGQPGLWRMPEYDFNVLLQRNIMHCGIMFPRRAWSKVGGYPANFAGGRDDWSFNVALGVAGYCGVNVKDKFGYLYRRAGQNRTLRNTNPVRRNQFLSKMKATFPAIYEGERPVGCCGGSRTPAPSARASRNGGVAMAALDSASGGMVLIEYLGRNAGDMTWWGKSNRYVIGGVHKQVYVAQEDVKTFLDTYEDNRPLFRLVPALPPVQEPKVRELEPTPKPEPVVALAEEETPDKTALVQPGDMTVAEFREWLTGVELSAEDLSLLRTEELAGRARLGVLRLLAAELEAVA